MVPLELDGEDRKDRKDRRGSVFPLRLCRQFVSGYFNLARLRP